MCLYRGTFTSFSHIPLPLVQLIIGGLGKIDLVDWKTNTRLKHCTSESNVVRWFWQAVEAFSEERRGRLLQFVTGSTRVPLQGFKALQGGSCTGSETTHMYCTHISYCLFDCNIWSTLSIYLSFLWINKQDLLHKLAA